MTGNKPDEEYIKEQKELNNAIKKAENETPKTDADKDLTMLHEILSTDFESVYKKWKNKELPIEEALKRLKLPRHTFYRMAKRYEEGPLYED